MIPENLSFKENADAVPSTTQSTVTLDRKECDAHNDYNPFEHRNIAHKTSTLGAFFHLLKSSLGSGLFAMPAAFKHTGLLPGFIGTMIVGVIATHCVHILVATSRDICRETRTALLSYTDTCEAVFKHGPNKLRRYSVYIRYFADSAMACVCLGGTSVYVIFIASSLKDIFDHFMPEHKIAVEAYCGLLLLPLILITQIRYLKFLVPFSIFANVCLVLIFGITCYYTFHDIPNPPVAEMVTGVTQWPLFLSTVIFAMEGINVVMPVENEMAKPEHFLGCPGVLNITMVFVTILYGIVGIFGYLKYGDQVLGSITLNLPQDEIIVVGPFLIPVCVAEVENLLPNIHGNQLHLTPLSWAVSSLNISTALIAKILVALAVFFTYCLQMYAPMEIIWTRLQNKFSKNYHNVSQIVLRCAGVLLTVVLATAVPDLELLIGLVGAIFFSTLGLMIPAVVQTVHRWDRGLGPCSYILFKNALILVFYFIVLLSGCYSAVSEIVAKYTT